MGALPNVYSGYQPIADPAVRERFAAAWGTTLPSRPGLTSLAMLGAILALWTQAKPAYKGRFVRFAGIQTFPRPAQRPHPPIVMGGHATEALRRAVRHASRPGQISSRRRRVSVESVRSSARRLVVS